VELSIAILVYCFSPIKLVEELLKQARNLGVNFEILVYDDGSGPIWQEQLNKELEPLPEVFLHKGSTNLGRAAGRNILASKASGKYILMIDGDNRIDSPHFLSDYFNVRKTKTVVVGGRYTDDKALPGTELRWLFAQKREVQDLAERKAHPYENFQTNCFLADAEIFQKLKFEENLKTYGYEDSLFGFALEAEGIPILHIQNPQYHAADDRNLAFLAKSEEAMESLIWIQQNHPQWAHRFKLLRILGTLKKWQLEKISYWLLNAWEKSLRSSLDSPGPSLWRFDLFRLHRLIQADLHQ